MRKLLLYLLVAWFTGMVLGTSEAPLAAIIGLVLVVALIGWRAGQELPLVVGAVVLLVLGAVYALEKSETVVTCPIEVAEPVIGHISEQPRIEEQRVQYVVLIEEQCLILVTAARFSGWQEGSVVRLSGGSYGLVAELPEELEGYRDYLVRRGIGATWRYPHFVSVGETSPLRSFGATWGTAWGRPNFLTSVRQRVSQRVQSVFVEPDASLVSAMLFAQRGTIPIELNEQFRHVGVGHVLAISGLHISIFAGFLYLVVSTMPGRPWWRTGVVIVILWVYITLIGMPISAFRAGLFWTAALLALRLELLISLPTILLGAAVGMITINPRLLLEVGWQLSFMAVLGIFGLLFLFRRTLVFTRGTESKPLLDAMRSVALVSIGAALFTWPIVLYHFAIVSPISVVANLLVVPLIPVLLLLAALALAVSLLAFPLALLVAALVHWILAWLFWITGFLAALPGAFFMDITMPVWLMVLYYMGLLVIFQVWLKHQGRSWREIWV
ncbi:ComEC/Rec2 family competence protein [Patescibacteria group bacterium]|nr:ComEC/Rec2 family competence protein [Patescibacteria group bacterium]